MTTNKQGPPLRQSRDGQVIETRPLHVEEWLDSLPYIDFNKTSRILEEATRLTNQQKLKPAVRLELVEMYSRPYLYYVESQIRTGAQQTLQSIESLQPQVDVLRRIAVNLAYAARLAAEDALKKKSLWGKARPPLQAMLFSMNYLSHALVFSYQNYSPIPKNVWRQLHFIYDFASDLERQNATLALPAGDTRHRNMSIAQAYKRILLAALADPYHLPYGAIWEIYEQLFNWTEYTDLVTFRKVPDPAGCFIVNLDSDSSPIPYNKFNVSRGGDRYRLLDATSLNRHIDGVLASWNGKPPAEMPALSPYYARLILNHLSRAWSLPPKRAEQRVESSGSLALACGVDTASFLFNSEKEVRLPAGTSEAEEIIAGEPPADDEGEVTPVRGPRIEHWEQIDQGTGGLALMKKDKPSVPVRVGELVTLMPERDNTDGWSVGVIRWLMAYQSGAFRLGIQVLSGTVMPAAVRAHSGSRQDRRYRQCLLLPSREDSGSDTVIAAKGLYAEGRQLELLAGGEQRRVRAGRLLEGTVAFEWFTLD